MLPTLLSKAGTFVVIPIYICIQVVAFLGGVNAFGRMNIFVSIALLTAYFRGRDRQEVLYISFIT